MNVKTIYSAIVITPMPMSPSATAFLDLLRADIAAIKHELKVDMARQVYGLEADWNPDKWEFAIALAAMRLWAG